MKKITTLLIACLFSATAFAQDTPAPINRSNPGPTEERLTESDKFLKRSGSLFEKQFVDIGRSKLVTVQVIKIKDLNSNASVSVLNLESKDITGIKDGRAKLDEDEIEGFLKSMKALKEAITTKRDNYTEIIYKSRGYFEAGAFYDEKRLKWKTFIQLASYASKTYMSMDEKDIDELVNLVEKAKIEMKKGM